MWKFIRGSLAGIYFWVGHIVSSAILFGILIFIVINFYIFSSIVNLDSFFYAFLLLSLLTDGAFTLIHFPRRRHHLVARKKTWCDPSKLTVVIACHNGAQIIGRTIRDAAKQVPASQIIVVDDASTDTTAQVARSYSVQVIVNPVNLHKVGSINVALGQVVTPYVLILDDDTLIGKTTIPTNLLDEGYTAVAFNVMPVWAHSLINELQRFEYRSSMQIGKHTRAKAGAIGNVSGAIGLYRTDDLRRQITMHSGQFAGEDEQRTLLAHIYGEGKGITYTDSLVLTRPPATYTSLFRQRAFSWSLAAPELFVLYWRILLAPRYHFLLKTEKAYLLYIYLTDPLRILFFWTLILRPSHLVTTYAFYLGLNILVWLRLGRRDTLRAVLISPLYTLFLTICRFIGYFYWFSEKLHYVSRRLYRAVKQRKLLTEYATIALVIVSSWAISTQHFVSEMELLHGIKNGSLTDNTEGGIFNYTPAAAAPAAGDTIATTGTDTISVLIDPGDNPRAAADKAVDSLLTQDANVTLSDSQRWQTDMWLARQLPPLSQYGPGKTMTIPKSLVQQAITVGLQGGTS